MAGNDVSITIGADGSKAKSELKGVADAAETSTGHVNKLGDALGGMAKIAGGIIAAQGITAIGGAIKGAFSDAVDFQKLLSQTDAVLKSTGDSSGMTAKSVRDLAHSLESATSIDDSTIQSAENMLLTFTKIGKDVFPHATEAVLNMATALGEDTQTAAVQLGKALNDPVQGVTALQRVGVKLTDSQKELVKSLVAVGDTAGAQKVILGELDTEFGNSARAAGQTLGGQLTLLKDAFSDAFRDLAMKVIPDLTKFATMALPLVSSALDTASSALSDLASAGADLAGLAWDKISGPLGDLAGFAWDKLQAGADAVVTFAKAAADLAAVAAPIILDKLRDFADSDTGQKLQGIFSQLKTNIAQTDTGTFAAGWDKVKSALQPAVDVLQPLVTKILVDLKKQVQDVSAALGPLFDALKPLQPVIEPLAKVIGTVLVGAIAANLIAIDLMVKAITLTLVGAIKGLTLVIEAVTKVFQDWAPIIGAAMLDVYNRITGVVGVIKGYFADAGTWLLQAGKDIIQGLIDGVKGMVGAVKDTLGGITDKIPSWKGPPEKDKQLLKPTGEMIMQGLADGLTSGFIGKVAPVLTAATGAIGDMLNGGSGVGARSPNGAPSKTPMWSDTGGWLDNTMGDAGLTAFLAARDAGSADIAKNAAESGNYNIAKNAAKAGITINFNGPVKGTDEVVNAIRSSGMQAV